MSRNRKARGGGRRSLASVVVLCFLAAACRPGNEGIREHPSSARSDPEASGPESRAEPTESSGTAPSAAGATEVVHSPEAGGSAPVPGPGSGATEPAAAGGGEESAEAAFRRLLAGMGVAYLPETRCLEVAGWVNMREGLVEVFACAPDGKTHESVVVLDCVPSGLHAGLLALGLEPGTPVETGTEADYRPPAGDGVLIEVRWKDASGVERTARAEEWVWNRGKAQPMEPVAWLFTGSFMQEVTGRSEEATYAANYVKSLVTTYHDASTVIENPLGDGRDDTLYYANDKAVPPVRTPVTAVFRAAER